MTPEQRSLRSRAAALRQHALYDGRTTTAAARAGQAKKWDDMVDPDRTLDPAERQRRATAAMKSHMLFLSLRSSRIRAARKAEREG